MPKALVDLEIALQIPKENGPLISAGCVEAIRSAAGLDMQIDEMVLSYATQAGNGGALPMPENLYL